MKRKLRVAILFGGRSAEHEVSIQSAKNVYQALDKTKYTPVLIGIEKQGTWHSLPPSSSQFSIEEVTSTLNSFPSLSPKDSPKTLSLSTLQDVDVVFPILHGPFGEDGTVQGLLKLMNLPFVGAGVLGSAVGMDKYMMKRLFREAMLPIVPFMVYKDSDKKNISFELATKQLGLPFFVKPANLGSSIGVYKVKTHKEFDDAVEKAFSYDRKILIEKGLHVREIECSVLGNEEKKASIPGEIIPTHEFYDYEAKYLDEQGARLEIPAKLTDAQINQIQTLAIKACDVLSVDGMARVDFFLDKDTNEIYLNEINTIPGFTNISMYPKLWEATGISYPELVDQLIQLAIDRHYKESQLQSKR